MSRYGRDPDEVEADIWAAVMIRESGVSDRPAVGEEDSLLTDLRNGDIQR